jgi:CRISPR-associated exonuclease Cas4
MDWTLTVTDLKQYSYCPRVFYYMRCLPDVRPVTAKMTEGIAAGEAAETREARRQLRAYGYQEGERVFGLALESEALGLRAVIDLTILRPDGRAEAIPVDYKLSAQAGQHFKVQLACYGLMLEEHTGLRAPCGFLYLIPERRAEKVLLTKALRERALSQLREMRAIVEAEVVPEATDSRNRCVNCEFRLFCNDVF